MRTGPLKERASRWRSRALLILVSAGIGGTCIAFVAIAITSRWSEVRDDLVNASMVWLTIAFVVAAAAMTWIGWCWSHALALTGHKSATSSDRRRGLAWYFGGELGKYVPGGVWTVLGRGELARRGGVAAGRSYASVTLSLVALYLAGLLLAAFLTPLAILQGARPSMALLVLAFLPLAAVGLHPRVLARGHRALVRVTRRGEAVVLPPTRATLGLIARYLPAWVLIWAATWCVARAFISTPSAIRIGAATMISWVAGITAVPVPAGAGVREATFVALAGLPVGQAATIAVTIRLVFIVVDLLGAAATAPWNVKSSPSIGSGSAP